MSRAVLVHDCRAQSPRAEEHLALNSKRDRRLLRSAAVLVRSGASSLDRESPQIAQRHVRNRPARREPRAIGAESVTTDRNRRSRSAEMAAHVAPNSAVTIRLDTQLYIGWTGSSRRAAGTANGARPPVRRTRRCSSPAGSPLRRGRLPSLSARPRHARTRTGPGRGRRHSHRRPSAEDSSGPCRSEKRPPYRRPFGRDETGRRAPADR